MNTKEHVTITNSSRYTGTYEVVSVKLYCLISKVREEVYRKRQNNGNKNRNENETEIRWRKKRIITNTRKGNHYNENKSKKNKNMKRNKMEETKIINREEKQRKSKQ